MSLAELRIQDVRCIQEAVLELAPGLNLIRGENGSGKTSILESVFLLGRGRSFRTRNSERLIRYGCQSLTVFGKTIGSVPTSAGISISREGTRARINGENAHSLLELSGVLAVQAIDPEIHKLVDQGPERRRRWLDWLVFHVEPTFGAHWARYQRALKQRNAALRGSSSDPEAWNAALVDHGIAITAARKRSLALLQPYLESLFTAFSELEVTVGFQGGWNQDAPLEQALVENAQRDRERASTTVGPHRADVILRTQGRSARETLSRGQQKLAAMAMIISQLRLLSALRGVRSTLLLDDPAAELDPSNLRRLFKELESLDCQMIATSLSEGASFFRTPDMTFHVEQGRVVRL